MTEGRTVSILSCAVSLDPRSYCCSTILDLPSVYRLARVAAGDGIAAVSLYAVSPHDVVAGHALLRAGGGGLWNEQGLELGYATPAEFNQSARHCFGGAEAACFGLMQRPWRTVLLDRHE
ncbi:hypothetical protein E8F06_09475 [Pseudomonas sp. BN411]|nr:hypothetical protein [Pseudomonas sp. BN411]MDH4656950.1 hypothetical protein [Pseudomonas sp. BN606]